MSVYDKIGEATKPLEISNTTRKSIADVLAGQLPPTAPREHMKQADDHDEDIAEMEEMARANLGGKAQANSNDDDDTPTGGDKTADPIGGESAPTEGEDMSDITAEFIPEFYEGMLQMGAEYGYEAVYEKKAQQLMAIRDGVQKASIEPGSEAEKTRVITALNERINYYNARIAGIEEAVTIKPRDKEKMTRLIAKMMEASETKIHPFWALVMLMLIPLINALVYIGKDMNKYKPEKVVA